MLQYPFLHGIAYTRVVEPIRCFLVEESGQARVSLRRYANFNLPAEERSRVHTRQAVSVTLPGGVERICTHRYGYHNAEVELGVHPSVLDASGHLEILPMPPNDDPRWPTVCECGYVFAEDDEWQINQNEIYVPAPGNEDLAPEGPRSWPRWDLPAGAMYYPAWLQPRGSNEAGPNSYVEPTDGSVLTVIVPAMPDGSGRSEWIVDAYCKNCDRKGQRHHCWCRRGTPPNVTVDKNPPADGLGTCSAGGGSIWIDPPRGWHGFLTGGWLRKA